MTTQTMPAAVLHGVKDLRVEQVPVPGAPGPGEVQVRIGAVGICGSDVHYYQHGRIGPFIVERPMILGHECAGTVVRVGEGVSDLSVGDRVCLEPGVPRLLSALSHDYLKEGKYNLCPDIFFCATPPDDGVFCTLVNHPAQYCFALPDNVSLEEGALVEPLSTGIFAARRAPINLGDTVVITGAGPIGLVNLLAAQAAGAARVIMSDVVPSRLAVAAELGASHTVAGGGEALRRQVLESTGGRGADVAIECAGHPDALNAAIGATRAGGTVVVIGLPPGDVATLNIADLVTREIGIRPIFRYTNTFATGVELLASGKVNVAPLISRRFSLQEVPEAFEYVLSHRDSCVKAIVNIPTEA